jgi:hypothetical protein
LAGGHRLQAAHRPQPILDRDVAALDGLGDLSPDAVQAGAGVQRAPRVAPDGAHGGLVLVRDDVVGADAPAPHGLKPLPTERRPAVLLQAVTVASGTRVHHAHTTMAR